MTVAEGLISSLEQAIDFEKGINDKKGKIKLIDSEDYFNERLKDPDFK